MKHVVVWDPEDKYRDGSLVDDGVAAMVNGRGGSALPVDATLFELGCGGYMRRGWGAGWPVDFSIPKMFCPLTLYVTKEHRMVHWTARLVSTIALSGPGVVDPRRDGTIQLAASTSRGNTYQAPLTPKATAKRLLDLGALDADGGWNIGGNAVVNVREEGNHAFALYGAGAGVRVVWAAITATRS